MTRRQLQQQARDERPVRCACGLTVRMKNWRDHWYTCRIGSGGPASAEDVQHLLESEARKREMGIEV